MCGRYGSGIQVVLYSLFFRLVNEGTIGWKMKKKLDICHVSWIFSLHSRVCTLTTEPPSPSYKTKISLCHIMTLLNREWNKAEWLLDCRLSFQGFAVQSCSSWVSDIITTTTLNLTLPLVTITALPPYSARNEKTDWSISVRPVKEGKEAFGYSTDETLRKEKTPQCFSPPVLWFRLFQINVNGKWLSDYGN